VRERKERSDSLSRYSNARPEDGERGEERD